MFIIKNIMAMQHILVIKYFLLVNNGGSKKHLPGRLHLESTRSILNYLWMLKMCDSKFLSLWAHICWPQRTVVLVEAMALFQLEK